MSDELDKLLDEVQAEQTARQRQEEQLRRDLTVDGKTREQLAAERREKVASFQLNLDLPEEEPAEIPAETPEKTAPTASEDGPEEPAAPAAGLLLEETEEPPAGGKPKRPRRNWGCAKGILYVVIVLAFAGGLTYFALLGIIDLMGLNKSGQTISVTIPVGSTTKDIAEILHEAGVIDQPLFFRLYSRLTGADGNYQPHEQLDLAPNMGYGDMIDELCAEQRREEVSVTIPEGYTLQEIAALLEEKKVCSQDDFFLALTTKDYSQYSFLEGRPTAADDEKYANRVYELEGYLFPDTYYFFTNSSAYSAICKMLDNFDTKLNTSLRTAIKAKGLTIDETVILASIIQGEAAKSTDMVRVSRVLYNRMDKPEEYPKLQCDSTTDYIIELLGTKEETAVRKAYDTYICEGLPVGPICNPGLDALQAAVSPTADATILKCYYFATDYSTGITYYSRTYAEHQAVCRKYGIGIYG